MNKHMKVLIIVMVIFSFVTLCIGYASLQNTLSIEGRVEYEEPEVILLEGEQFNSELSKLGKEVVSITFALIDSNDPDESSDTIDIAGLDETDIYVDEHQIGLARVYTCDCDGGVEVYVLSDRRKIYANPKCNYMFSGRKKLSSITFGEDAFDTSKVNNMSCMFQNCIALTELDLSMFNTAKVTAMEHMFDHCLELTTVYVSGEWTTVKVDLDELVFDGIDNLTGGQGTTVDNEKRTALYARIDGGANVPGLFTVKTE